MRHLLAVLLCLAGSVFLAGEPANAAGLAFVLNSAGASISVIDMKTQTELRRIPALREPHHLVLSPDGRELLIGDTAGNEILTLDPGTGAVLRRVPVVDPYQLGFSPDGKFLTVTGLARNQIDILDPKTFALKKRFPAKSMPSHLAYSPDSSMVFVTLQGTDSLMAIDLKTMTPRWTTPVGKTPAGVIWHNNTLLVANMGSDNVAIVDPIDGRVTSRLITGKGAHTLFLSPDQRTLYVNNRVAGTTVALDAKTLKPVRTYMVSGGPDDIDFAPDGKLWITRRFASRVALLDPVTGTTTDIDVGRSPHGIWLNPRAP